MIRVELGFETIGNATVIVHDRGPLLVTDPWLGGPAYFGSWTLSHEIPVEQLESALAARFVWFSHGHPDHLNGPWLEQFRDRTILLPDHYGGRIKQDLERAGLAVRVLPHASWVPLSENVRVWCYADINQDAVLLIDLRGTLLIDINDATQTGWGPPVRREARKFQRRVLLQLSGYGDADMINFFDESGHRLAPLPKLRKDRGYRVGDALSKAADGLGATHVIPFSSMHRYQRDDSSWANEFTVSAADYADGFCSRRAELMPPFVRYDSRSDEWAELRPREVENAVIPSHAFGDDWSEELAADEVAEVAAYLRRIDKLRTSIGFLNFRVGGREHRFEFDRSQEAGVTFDVPRGSLLMAVRYQIFDDLLIGNFMRTTLHGKWPANGLSARFGQHVTRYADNGFVYSDDEVARYVAHYRQRALLIDRVRSALEGGGARLVRSRFQVDSLPYRAVRKGYWAFKRATR